MKPKTIIHERSILHTVRSMTELKSRDDAHKPVERTMIECYVDHPDASTGLQYLGFMKIGIFD